MLSNLGILDFIPSHQDDSALATLLDVLTPNDVRVLAETLDEESRRGDFLRVFPSSYSHKYLRYFEQPRYANLLLDVWTQRYLRMEARGELGKTKKRHHGLHLPT